MSLPRESEWWRIGRRSGRCLPWSNAWRHSKSATTPIVSICGGEPLEYPEIAALTRAILERGHHLFLCTDGHLIRRRLHMIPPYTNFFWNVKLDGTQSVHDARANRTGLFEEALDGVKAAKNAGFFVVVNSTIYPDTDVE